MYEPSADARMAAKSLFDFYSALVHEGFTENQALAILLSYLGRSV